MCVLYLLHGVVVVCRCALPSRGRAGAGSSLLGAGSSPLVVAGCGVVRAGCAAVFCAVCSPAVLLHFNFR